MYLRKLRQFGYHVLRFVCTNANLQFYLQRKIHQTSLFVPQFVLHRVSLCSIIIISCNSNKSHTKCSVAVNNGSAICIKWYQSCISAIPDCANHSLNACTKPSIHITCKENKPLALHDNQNPLHEFPNGVVVYFHDHLLEKNRP